VGGKGGRCVGLTPLPPSCADCLEIWDPQPPGTHRACPGLYWDCCTFLQSCLYLLQLLGHGLDSRRFVVWVWQGEEIRVLSEASRRALGPTQLPAQRVPLGVLPGEADHLHVVARFGMSGLHRSNVHPHLTRVM